MRALKLTIPNRLADVGRMSQWLGSAMRRLELPEKLCFQFDLCANEAVTNIISYAYPDDDTHEIVLRLYLNDNAVELEIEDDGIPFNPLAKPEHAQPANLEDAKIGGLGIDLIRKFMDECRYVRESNRNILKMIAIIPRPGT